MNGTDYTNRLLQHYPLESYVAHWTGAYRACAKADAYTQELLELCQAAYELYMQAACSNDNRIAMTRFRNYAHTAYSRLSENLSHLLALLPGMTPFRVKLMREMLLDNGDSVYWNWDVCVDANWRQGRIFSSKRV